MNCSFSAIKMKTWFELSLFFIFISFVYGSNYKFGHCPQVRQVENFDMNLFAGKWYLLEKTRSHTKCVTYEFLFGNTPEDNKIILNSPKSFNWFSKTDVLVVCEGKILQTDAHVGPKMMIQFPKSLGGITNYTVISTDYMNYAVIFSCQQLALLHRQSVMILSRGKTLDRTLLTMIKAELTKEHLNSHLNVVPQNNCPDTNHMNTTSINDMEEPNNTAMPNNTTVLNDNMNEIVKAVGEESINEIMNNLNENTEDVSNEIPRAFVRSNLP